MSEMSFGERLRTSREKVKLSQVQVMERIHVSNKSISHWENNRTTPPVHIINELAELYNVSSDYLLGIEPDRTHDILSEVFKDNKNAINILDNIVVKKDGLYSSNGNKIPYEYCKKIYHAGTVLLDVIESSLDVADRKG